MLIFTHNHIPLQCFEHYIKCSAVTEQNNKKNNINILYYNMKSSYLYKLNTALANK